MDFQTFLVCKVYYKKLYQTFCIPFSTYHLEYGLPLTLYFTDTQTLLKRINNSSTKSKKVLVGFFYLNYVNYFRPLSLVFTLTIFLRHHQIVICNLYFSSISKHLSVFYFLSCFCFYISPFL